MCTWCARVGGVQYAPYILELDEATRYVWCQCGVSMKQPFCDSNSHRSECLPTYTSTHLSIYLSVHLSVQPSYHNNRHRSCGLLPPAYTREAVS